jgi:DNA ligase-4
MSQKNEISQLIQQCSCLDLKWLARIILKDLKLGIGYEVILKTFHPKSLDVYNATSDLKQVFKEVDDYDKLKGGGIYKVFFPVRPMLAGKMNLDQVAYFVSERGDCLSGVCVETKFDGERIQCHLKEQTVMFFSRNSHDVTKVYGPKLGHKVRDAVSE